ncbi:UbiA family prenyltransferase [Streptomyces pactum]|uniref:UbiA family prenyltransferase n=1 Tax=Streptomyces pactum TaxID=68249 RepID=A0ABS0NRE7_9ACTN|nr:UbiA family prenyltransferase [Streptomyces pactum]MBH5337778.1 UbiA family prenyltransferase [Streptomyces pactum]
MARFTAVVELVRPRTLLVTPLSYCVGVAVADHDFDFVVLLGVVFHVLAPLAANAHNAVTDLVEDGENVPGRLKLVETAGVRVLQRIVPISLGIMLLLSLAISLAQSIIWIFSVFLVLGYSSPRFRLKGLPVTGMAVFAMAVTEPFIAGALLADSWWEVPHYDSYQPVALGAFLFFWYFAKGIMKNVPDYAGDKAAGLRTIPALMSSQRSAAWVAAVATTVVYAAFPVLVLVSALPDRLAYVGLMTLPAVANMIAMVRARTQLEYNLVGQRDMYVSVVFLGLLLFAWRPSVGSALIGLLAVAVMVWTDVSGRDSRASRHLDRTEPELSVPGGGGPTGDR